MNAAKTHIYYAQNPAQLIRKIGSIKQIMKPDGTALMTAFHGRGATNSQKNHAIMT